MAYSPGSCVHVSPPELGKLGFAWQFCTLAGFHTDALMDRGMRAYTLTHRHVCGVWVETLTHQ
eukprot:gene40076-21183_t